MRTSSEAESAASERSPRRNTAAASAMLRPDTPAAATPAKIVVVPYGLGTWAFFFAPRLWQSSKHSEQYSWRPVRQAWQRTVAAASSQFQQSCPSLLAAFGGGVHLVFLTIAAGAFSGCMSSAFTASSMSPSSNFTINVPFPCEAATLPG